MAQQPYHEQDVEDMYADRAPAPAPAPVPQFGTLIPFPPAGSRPAPAPAPPAAKSVVLAGALAFLFGPFGMLYSTVVGALTMLGIDLVLLFIDSFAYNPVTFVMFMLTWPACMVWAVRSVGHRRRQDELPSGDRPAR